MTKIVGHRGVAGYAPENTLRSFEMAIEFGCDRAELDVHLSKDGEVIVIHDDDVARITGGVGKVADMTLAKLKELRCPEYQEIPTLQEVIDLTKGKISLQIELKAKGTPEAVNRLLLKNGIEGDVVLISFDVELLREMKKLNPRLQVGFLFDHIPETLWGLVSEIPLEFIGPRSIAVTKELVEEAHSRGLLVYAYHVDTKELGEKLITLGVDEIGTDFPKLFITS